MQSITSSGEPNTTSSIGGGGGRGGLARFRSAPATWLDDLLEDDEEEEDEDDPLKQNQCFTQLLTGNTPKGIDHASAERGFSISYGGGGVLGPRFLRQNSSPGEFLGNLGYGGGKRGRDDEYASQVRGEQSGAPLSSGLMDLEVDRLFEDSAAAPCKFRAKRGFATHPRSIAERVRRTRISDRIRKLQELIPNMDKQINTADMLDEAVEYVKHLQKQIKVNYPSSKGIARVRPKKVPETHNLHLLEADSVMVAATYVLSGTFKAAYNGDSYDLMGAITLCVLYGSGS